MFPEDNELTTAAWKENPQRYAELEPKVFNATVPFGSAARWTPAMRRATKPKACR